MQIKETEEKIITLKRIIKRSIGELNEMISQNRQKEMFYGKVIASRYKQIRQLEEQTYWKRFLHYCHTGKFLE